jgi:hypothetical protein
MEALEELIRTDHPPCVAWALNRAIGMDSASAARVRLAALSRLEGRTKTPWALMEESVRASASLAEEAPGEFARKAWFALLRSTYARSASVESLPSTVEIAQGKLQGNVKDGVLRFNGIPYARPPVGDLRWQPPQTPEAWAGVRDASHFGNIAPQTMRPQAHGGGLGV